MNLPAWRYFGGFYKGSRLRLMSAMVMSMVQVLIYFLILFLVRYSFDSVIPSGKLRPLVLVGLSIISLYIFNGGIMLWTRSIVLNTTETVIQRFRTEILKKNYALPRSYSTAADRNNLHAIVVQDTERLDIMSNALFAQLIPALLISICIVTALVYLNWSLALPLIGLMPLLFIWNKIMGGKVRERVYSFHRSFETFSKGTMFVLRVMDLTRMQSAEQIELEKQGHNLERLGHSRAHMVWINTAYHLGQNAVIAILSIVILIVGGSAVSSGRMTLGELITFYAAVVILKNHFQMISFTIPQIIEGDESLTTLHNWLEIKEFRPYRGTKQIDFRGKVVFESVCFQYAEHPTLHDIRLSIDPGTTTAIYGPNGAGKTSIANLILGFYRPQAGEIYMDDQPLSELDVVHLRRYIGVVRQDPIFFPSTIWENIIYGSPDIDPQRVIEMAGLATAHEFIDNLPNGYETFVGEDGMQLSGGQRQRLAITRSLLRQPRLLILDEPTLNLDGLTVHRLVNNFRNLQFAPAILLISHDLDIIKEAPNVYILEEGCIIKSGSYETLDLEHFRLTEV